MSYRSLLYVPAHAERFLVKAHERGADAIILDLEDAVPPDRKLAARQGLAEWVPSVRRSGAAVFVRINSEAGLRDEDVLAAARAGADGLYLPKVGDAADIRQLEQRLAPAEAALGRPPLRFIALIETPAAVLDARAIAAASPRLLALSLGGEDLALAMDAEPSPEVLRLPKLLVHYAAKAAGLLSFGLLRSTADYSDRDAIVAAAREARAFGFDGASCVHPALVPILNEAFSPTPAELGWAEAVLAAAPADGSAFSFDGKMVDAPVVARARRLLARRLPGAD